MTKITAIIIDDEAPARDLIKTYLKADPEVEVLTECSNGFDAVKAVQELKPDVLFLDIQMPKITGFEMLELLDDKPVIIFVTAYDQYALKAFEASAADYLLKPFSRARFSEALDRARLFIKEKSQHDKVVANIQTYHEQQQEYLQRIVVKDKSQIFIVPVQKIFRLEAQDDYVMLCTPDGELLKQKTMKFFENHLDPGEFVRIHRSHIVRISFIKQIELFGKDSYKAVLRNGDTLPVSRSGHSRLKEILD